jgi:hypothetical protein
MLWLKNKPKTHVVQLHTKCLQIPAASGAGTAGIAAAQEAKYVESWPNTTSAWAG